MTGVETKRRIQVTLINVALILSQLSSILVFHLLLNWTRGAFHLMRSHVGFLGDFGNFVTSNPVLFTFYIKYFRNIYFIESILKGAMTLS